MQLVLVIDLTRDPASALVVDVSSPELTVVEREVLPRGAYLEQILGTRSLVAEGDEASAEESPSPGAPENLIEKLIAPLSSDWGNSVVVLPPVDYVSLFLKTPFTDPKRLEQVLALEVQDAIPFELEEMQMQYRVHGAAGNEGNEVHVSLMPRRFLLSVIEQCREAGVEGTVITTLSSLLGVAIDEELPGADRALIYWRPPFLSLGIWYRGAICADRVVECHDGDPVMGLRDIRMALVAFEQRYETSLGHIHVFGEPLSNFILKDAFPGREVHTATLASHEDLTRKAARFASDSAPVEPFVNFRSGALRVRLRWGEIGRGLRELYPYLMGSLTCLVVAFGVIYYSRMSRVEAVRESTISKIAEVIPYIDRNVDRPSDFLRTEISVIQKQLRDLGSPFQLSPVDALLDVGKDIQRRGGITISRVMILGNKVTVEGTTQDYKATDTLEDNFQKKRKVYCDVKKDVTPMSGGTAGAARFTLKLELCE